MTGALAIRDTADPAGIRWTPMLILSLALHLALFFMVLFLPDSIPSGRIKGIVYEVDLVEAPSPGPTGPTTPTTVEKKAKTGIVKDTQAKRILVPKVEKKPLVVAKRTVKRKSTKKERPEVSSSKLIDEAISRIEKKVKSEDSGGNHVEKAISELEKKAKAGSFRDGSGGGGRSLDGIPIMLYQAEVENWIKSNWSYPVAVQDQKKLEAVVMLQVSQDGTITKSWFKKRSSDDIFDQSVLRAIDRSNPLPPFPEGYRKSYEEFEINFNLKDFEDS